MKKGLALVLVALMVTTISATAFAAEVDQDSNPQTGNTAITYSVSPTYTVTIPATVTVGSTAEIKAENVVVEKGSQVVVTLSDANGFKVSTAEGSELTYTVKIGENTVNENTAVLTVNPDTTASGSTTLSFIAPTSVQFAGTYTGTVTFTVSVEAAQ